MESFEQILVRITAIITTFGFHFLSGYFAVRLYVTFKDTPYQLSKCTKRCVGIVLMSVILSTTSSAILGVFFDYEGIWFIGGPIATFVGLILTICILRMFSKRVIRV